ncbi:DUF2795 domain-containing protein [Bailinhaonella thermotolerans]|uniref:DUF2795 domain-containing protein n=1 Tax=Bailinhaonella thermotolerans TaxID=1070861 RepID=A0A3A4AT41_9ACTN|nr:DUF2795 domain-containing protein [Bailinhaonella thermotolerans]RJL22732.1 DUF2795 domain-containing protein [Bailinhaonella thermotolerans]
MKLNDPDEIGEVLHDFDFPADKEQLVDHARRVAPGSDVARALAALPLGSYDNLAEVVRSVPQDPAPNRNAAQRTAQKREHPRGGIAESERPVPPSPIEQAMRQDVRRSTGGRPRET